MLTEVLVVSVSGGFECDLDPSAVEFMKEHGFLFKPNTNMYSSPNKKYSEFNSGLKNALEGIEDADAKKEAETAFRQSYTVYADKTVYIGHKELAEYFKLGVSLKIEGTAYVEVDSSNVGEAIYDRFLETAQKFVEGVQKANELAFNAKCGVPKVDEVLIRISEVRLFEDCCTDELQRQLNQGWRIISVCPQPDQRRPDYILGRVM